MAEWEAWAAGQVARPSPKVGARTGPSRPQVQVGGSASAESADPRMLEVGQQMGCPVCFDKYMELRQAQTGVNTVFSMLVCRHATCAGQVRIGESIITQAQSISTTAQSSPTVLAPQFLNPNPTASGYTVLNEVDCFRMDDSDIMSVDLTSSGS